MLDNWIYYFQDEWTANVAPYYPVIYVVIAGACLWYGAKKTSVIGLLLGALMVLVGFAYLCKMGFSTITSNV